MSYDLIRKLYLKYWKKQREKKVMKTRNYEEIAKECGLREEK